MKRKTHRGCLIGSLVGAADFLRRAVRSADGRGFIVAGVFLIAGVAA
jgi:hypothetical protein